MASSSDRGHQAAGIPLKVTYDPITGVPAEFNEYLPKDCDEHKKWKAAQAAAAEAPAAELQNLKLPAENIEKKLPGGKVKKKSRPEVILERNTRNKKKCVTTVLGLDTFGVKLQDASKLFGKKFASGAAITKNPMEKDQIDVQGDFLDQAAELILKTYGKDKGISKGNIFIIENKKKAAYFGDDDDDDEDDIIMT
ncbi:hypothetical protein WJX84_000504 [Apatococcus fuscideae]|uniref:SUI1 domain-containing protein n=1 Tax=Apatococcus fuscideae TaxID=2026836 RepID=A0AAW1RR15_9CHLO